MYNKQYHNNFHVDVVAPSRKSRPLDTTMTVTAPKLFTDIHPIEASSLPRPESDEYQNHIDEIVAAATEAIESTPTSLENSENSK
jgi:hypothetical protein